MEPDELDEAQSRIVAALRDWRRGRAGGNPAYTVCRDVSLREIARNTPRERAELLAIRGIGQGFVTNHADDLFQTLASLDTVPSVSEAH
jgi:ribonuclease D